ncbi:signal peptidase I [Agromyces cerinus]|uniref:Signal peptidase I n=1 Tax=Agromyces cerinus subsp. cerinus TaxID=232089 RepID=A0A1N6DMF9_9MICO|nr:signal peptidase I [Agromyces cerinus]SIN72001.1 signal peptidase I [Agromyces cerinus subsp. cerinus]
MTEEDTGTRTDRAASATPNRRRGVLLFLRDLLVIFVVAVLVSFLIKTFLIRSFFIPSQSMEETLFIDDRIIVNQLVPDVTPLERGDVIVFRDPGGWLPARPEVEQPPLVAAVDWFLAFVGLAAPDSNDHLVKRLIGLPGDHVVCCNALGQMSVNDVPLDEPYIALPPGDTKASRDDFDVVVPEGSLWVMGDNRNNSKDSRYNTETPLEGFVPIDNVVGRAFVVSWPVEHWAWLDNYPEVFEGVDEAGD